MVRLPIPGEDDDVWGKILNGFLEVSHNSDGTLRLHALTEAGAYVKPTAGIPASDLSIAVQTQLAQGASAYQKPPSGIPLGDLSIAVRNAISGSGGVQSVNGKTGAITLAASDVGAPTALSQLTDVSGTSGASNNQVLSFDSAAGKWVPATVTTGNTAPDATTSSPGLVQLTGDLSGTATNPTVPGKVSTNIVTTKGDLLAATGASALTRLAVGGNGQVLTADSSQTSGLTWTTVSGGATNATTTSPGLVQLAGDLSGGGTTATAPKVNFSNDTLHVLLSGGTMTGTLIVPSLRLTTSPAQGDVLTSDSSGNATWQALPADNSHSVVTKTGAYTLTTADEVVLANASSGSFTLTLPTASGNKNLYDIKKVDNSANTVTVAASGGQTIDGGGSAVIKIQYASMSIVSDGSNWFII